MAGRSDDVVNDGERHLAGGGGDERKRFYCREWAFQKLAHCLEQRPASKTCGALLLGGAGCGKTTFCGELCWPSVGPGGRAQRALNRRLLAHHFLHGHDEQSLSLSEFVRSLVTQILNHSTESHRERSARRHQQHQVVEPPPSARTQLADAYLEKLKADAEIQSALRAKNIEARPDDCLKRALLFPLLEIEPPPTALFILVDAIDEHAFDYRHSTLSRRRPRHDASQSRSIAELLASHHHLLPHWLLLVCTARKQSKSIARMFTGFRKLALDDLRKAHVVRDLQQYILARLDDETSLRQHMSRDTAEMLNQLHVKSNGCFLYVEKVLDGIADGCVALRDVREIPGTLNGLYLWLAQRLFTRRQFGRVQPLLNVLLAARAPLTHLQLAGVLADVHQLDADEFRKRMHLLRRVVRVTARSGVVQLFHHSFAEWLLDVKHCTQKYLCNIFDGHCTLAMHYTQRANSLSHRDIFDFAFHLSRVELYVGDDDGHKQEGPIYAKIIKKDAVKVTDDEILDTHTLSVLWLVHSGCPMEECLLAGDETGGVDFGACLPTDSSVLKLLLDAGAVEQQHNLTPPIIEPQLPTTTSIFDDDEEEKDVVALHVAARLGQVNLVESLLSGGADANMADGDGWTPLRAAAWGGHVDVVNALLRHGCALDAEDGEQRTALRAAAWSGHEEVVRALIANGADVNHADGEGRTALIAAAYMGHADIVDVLLAAGALVDHADADGRTALSVAALCAPRSPGVSNVVQTLLERGAAAVDHADAEGMTPLLVAAFEGHRDVCETLLENDADVDHVDAGGRSPLWAAASMGHALVVELLLFWGCCVDAMDADGRTVLSVAAAQGCAAVVRQLLARGLDEQHRDHGGWTPLHYAAFEGHADVADALLEAGARVADVDNEGRAPLALAAQAGHAHLVDVFVERYHASCDQRAHDGKTALRMAALEGHFDVVAMLVARGADVDAPDADGRSALYVLALDNRLPMATFMVQRAGADVEARDLEGRTPLHVAAWQGHVEMVRMLLTVGNASVDAVDGERRTALHSAGWQGHAPIVRLLLEAGAVADHACNQGATALGIAAQEGHAHCVLALLEHGADPHHADACGRSAIRVAAKSGHRHVVRLLEEFTGQRGGAKTAHTSSSATSITSAETQPSNALLTTATTSSNSKSTGSSSQSSSREPPPTLNFTQQLQQQCARKVRPLSTLPSEPQSPIYASPPLSPVRDVCAPLHGGMMAADIYQPIGMRQQHFATPPDTHFARDTHMRIILGQHSSAISTNGGCTSPPSDSSKPKRNGIVTNPALRLVANVKNGLDTAAANLRKSATGAAAAASTKTNSFHWRKETPL